MRLSLKKKLHGPEVIKLFSSSGVHEISTAHKKNKL